MIIYFSGTGNSRYIAESIGALNEDSVINASQYTKVKKSGGFTSEKPFVFVCPTYAWRIPRIFEEFIKNSTFYGNAQVYFIMTCGTDTGNAGRYLEKLSRQKKFDYKGTLEIIMPENYIAMYDATDKETSEKLIANAQMLLPDIADSIKKGINFSKTKIELTDELKSRFVNPLFYTFVVNAKGFTVSNQCIGCGKCEKLCPLNNISLINKKPKWEMKCTHCMACISVCPREAIEYKKASVGKSRYFNDKKVL